MIWTTACKDWADRLRKGLSIIPGPIFEDRAAEALAVFKELRIVDAPGQPTFGEASEQWVFDLVAAIFGSYDAQTGRRLVRECLVLIPKKNSKSTLAAGIMVTALALNWRFSAEMLILAPTIKIAKNAFDPAYDMIRSSPKLSKVMHVSPHEKTIKHMVTGAVLKVLAADSDTVGGNKASWVLVDELWLFGKREGSATMFREAFGGLASRPEGIVIKLSTQSDEPPTGVFKEDLALYRDIRDGKVVDDKRLPVLYEHPPEMVADGSALLLENLRMVNPNYGKSVDAEFLRDEYVKAERTGIGALRDFLAKHGNVELGLNLRNDRWAGADFWEAQADPELNLDRLLERSDVVVAGIDGGGLDDLLGLCIMGRCKQTRKWLVWCHAWAHKVVLERRKDIAEKLEELVACEDLTIVELPGEDVRELCDIIKNVDDLGLLAQKHAIGVDPAGISAIVDMLTSPVYGIELDRIAAVSQGWRMSGAIKSSERAVAGKTLVHCGQRLMAWCVSNAKATVTGSATNITKQHSGTAKIDPLMAMFNAASLMGLNPEGRGSLDNWLKSMAR